MKKNHLIAIFLISILFAFCKKDTNSTDETATTTTSSTNTSPEMKCVINGKNVTFTTHRIQVTFGHSIIASDSSHSLIINLFQQIKPGSFKLSSTSSYMGRDLDSGNFTCTDTANHKASGTFYFYQGSNIGKNGTFKNIPMP